MHLIVADQKGFEWFVFDTKNREIASGHTLTYEHAVRAARNFIRRNQNLVFL